MFEYKDLLFNPRYVVSIGKIESSPLGFNRFTVVFTTSVVETFSYEKLQDATQKRDYLRNLVNSVNGRH
jgi:hypothetical protein